ncbi:MAG TPA: SGNH/GDSL hydrolase family protein [Pyrinomonadaceae bacterium]|jgi:lysophospholipase L1-like esterase|nr:SGNH/GDSL hydrolase family protein [Pyrinomonadaceae bacterium]
MTTNHLRKAFLLVPGLVALIFLTASSAFADCPNQVNPPAGDTFQMLVLGDSIMWGQGLKDDEKFTSRVKCWLQEKTNREVNIHMEAHSGAIISGAAQPVFTTSDGEVNLTSPTINEELDHAVQFYKQTQTSPALILMNGCINDVGVKNLLAAATPLEDLRAQVKQNCGEKMSHLLGRVRNSFPQSQVVVTGYYPIVSLQTDDNAFLRLLVKKLNNQRPEARRMTDKEMRQRLIVISEEWYRSSTADLADAVMKANAGLPPTSPKVLFAEIQFGPEHVFAAPETLLWTFLFASTNVSGFAKVVVLLSFGTAAYKANDHVRESRIKSCEATFKQPKGVKEDKQQKDARKDLFLICRYASLGHPNHMGALIYSEAIKGQLLRLIDSGAWKHDTNSQLGLQ